MKPNKTKSKIILVKKYANYKGYRRGKKFGIMRLPALVLDNKILWQGIAPKKRLEEVVEEILNQTLKKS